MAASEVSIIIPIYNQLDYTRNCLRALRSDSDIFDNAEIVVVDNGSGKDTQEFLRSEVSHWNTFKVFRFEQNSGFAVACNAGAEIASGNELVFLNNDTSAERGWLATLRKTLRMSNVGIVGPKLLFPDSRTINHAGYVYNKQQNGFYSIYSHFPEDFPGANRRREFQALLGACFLMRREVFEEVGGFSNIGLEDIDLCLKVRKLGLKVLYEPRAVLLHFGSVTLRLSAPGSIPQTDVVEFNRRWPRESQLEDDWRYYSEDGFAVKEYKGENVFFREVLLDSAKLVREGQDLLQAGQSAAAQEKFEAALALHLGNITAYEELIAIEIFANNVPKAIEWTSLLSKHIPEHYPAKVLLARLLKQSGKQADLHSLLEALRTDWTCPADIFEQIKELGL